MYEMLRGWERLLCKFIYFLTNALVEEFFSLAWSSYNKHRVIIGENIYRAI